MYVIIGIICVVAVWILIDEAYNQGYRQGRLDEHLQYMGDDNDNQ